MAVPEGKASPAYFQQLFKTFVPSPLSAGILILAKKDFFTKN